MNKINKCKSVCLPLVDSQQRKHLRIPHNQCLPNVQALQALTVYLTIASWVLLHRLI